MAEFHLTGLDGGNPLAFLAALGALRTSHQAWPDRRPLLAWDSASGGWRPMLILAGDMSRDEWLAGIDQALREPASHDAFSIADDRTAFSFLVQTRPQDGMTGLSNVDDLTVPCPAFEAAAMAAAENATAQARSHPDFLAAFGSDVVQAEVNGKKNGQIADTALRTMGGAGHQHFLGFMRELARATEVDHLRSALFDTWNYTDPGPSMRWDPADDRRYALRWLQPSGDPTRTVRGANRLAIEGLPLLPTAPVQGRLETTGFTQRKGQGAVWSWPIWNVPLSLDGVRSLLALRELGLPEPDRGRLAAMGIVEVYRSQRITQGKYRNFTPARPA